MSFFHTPHLSLLALFFLSATLSGCQGSDRDDTSPQQLLSAKGCISCHQANLDENHRFGCTRCHNGNDQESTMEKAHIDLVSHPAHPDHFKKSCAGCHPKESQAILTNSHYNLDSYAAIISRYENLTATDKRAEKKTKITTVHDIHSHQTPVNGTELLEDMVRRKCLRCHMYNSGDDFSHTTRAQGCGSCHLSFSKGHLQDHHFSGKPKDNACLSCHYGNHVGFDFYGHFEHDFNEEYRTPYSITDQDRPYGLEYHELQPDIHQLAGMVCIDCHSQQQVMGNSTVKANCRSCHDQHALEQNKEPGIEPHATEEGCFTFTSTATGQTYLLPIMTHPAHERFGDTIDCMVCHAQWSFIDRETHLLRIDHEDFDDFERLSRDGDSWVHHILKTNIDFDSESIIPYTVDRINGERISGIWIKGYKERRWENPPVILNESGTLNISRPVLDLHLSWIDYDEETQFDNFKPFSQNRASLPYTPHTTGAAGPYYLERIKPFFPVTSQNE